MQVDSFLGQFQPIDLPLYGVKLPKFSPPDSVRQALGVDSNISNFDFLRKLCLDGFKKLNLSKGTEDYQKYADRVKYELSIIEELGFTDYILLVWDIINFCKEKEIPVGPGRGSAAGSAVLFLIGVTKIDPIKYGLYFERFISKVRAKKKVVDGTTYLDGKLMCDVDMDISFYRRGEVIEYLEEKFQGRVSKIGTINTLSGKLLIKECGKIVGDKSEAEMNDVSSYIPKHFGRVSDIQETCEGVKDADGNWKTPPVEKFADWCAENPEVYKTALKLRDLIKNKGVHASGILLSCDPLDESCPQELTSDKELVSSYSMEWAALINVKVDLLGLRSVSVVDDICKQLGISVDSIDPNDPFIYECLQDLSMSKGVFQLEAQTNNDVCKKVKPKEMEQLSAVLALARPGALSFVDRYADYANEGKVDLPDVESEKFKELLGREGGTLLYQESVLRVGSEVFGLSLDFCESLRRLISKKKKDEFPQYEKIIKDKGAELGIPKTAEFWWKILLAGADYAFNRCNFEEELVELINGQRVMLKNVKVGDKVKAYDTANDREHYVEVKNVYHNERDLFEVTLPDGKQIRTSLDHKFLCEDGKMHTLKDVISYRHQLVTD